MNEEKRAKKTWRGLPLEPTVDERKELFERGKEGDVDALILLGHLKLGQSLPPEDEDNDE